MGLAAPAHADGPPDNAAVVIDAHDFAHRAKSAFKVEQVPEDTVDQKNTAYAYSSCDQCTSCQTYAAAFQFVMETDGPMTSRRPEASRSRRSRKDMKQAAHSDASLDEIKARLDADASQLQSVLQTQLVQSGNDGQVDEYDDSDSG